MQLARTTIWRDPLTYIWIGIGILATLGIVLVWAHREYDVIFLPIAILLLVVAILWSRRQATMRIHDRELRLGVEVALGHKASVPLTRSTTVSGLRGGQGGWAQLYEIGEYGDLCYIDANRQLSTTPSGNCPILIVRDDDGGLHLFRFGAATMTPLIEFLPDGLSCELIDHGVVGPARFALAA